MKKIIAVILPILVAACEHDNWEKYIKPVQANLPICDTSVVIHYTTDIVPILNASCGAQDNACHSSATGSGFTILDVYAGVQYSGTQSGNPPYKLISCITHDGNASSMPKNGYTITPCEINKIIAWVHQGTLNN